MGESTEEKKQKFNTKVTHRDPSTGVITKQDPYILRTCGEQGSQEKARYWERPAGSGNLFDSHNNPIGRWEYEEATVRGKKVKQGKFVADAKHIAFKAPETGDQKLARELAAQAAENAALKAELDAIKAEAAGKPAAKPGAAKEQK